MSSHNAANRVVFTIPSASIPSNNKVNNARPLVLLFGLSDTARLIHGVSIPPNNEVNNARPLVLLFSLSGPSQDWSFPIFRLTTRPKTQTSSLLSWKLPSFFKDFSECCCVYSCLFVGLSSCNKVLAPRMNLWRRTQERSPRLLGYLPSQLSKRCPQRHRGYFNANWCKPNYPIYFGIKNNKHWISSLRN